MRVALWIAACTAVVSGAVWAVTRTWDSGDKTMKIAWFILLVKAGITFTVAFTAAWQASMIEAKGEYPAGPAVVSAVLGGLVTAGLLMLDALKANTGDSAALRGIEFVEITKTPGKTEIAGKPEPGQVERSSQHVAPPAPR